MSERIQTGGNAVRWAHRFYGKELDFTTWHYGVNDGMTACGRYVPKEDKAWVETAPAKQTSCKQCLNRYATKEAIKEQP
jgi:hypothetical protein